MFKDIFKGDAGIKIKSIFPCLEMLDDFGVGVAFISPQMEILALNKITKKWFPHIKVGERPICYKSFNVPPRDEICDYCPTIKALSDGKVHEAITDTQQGDRIVNYRVVASPLKDSSGNIIAAVEIVEDVTERKQAEDALRVALEKREELEAIINRSPGIVFLWRNAEGWPVEFVSDNISQFGYTTEDFTSGRVPYAKIVYPDDLERVAAEVAKYSKEGCKEFTQEYRILTKSGDVRWLDDRTWVRRNSNGVITHYQGVVFDITERKRLEEQIKVSEEKYRKFFEDTNDAIFIADTETGQLLDANKQAERLIGRTKEEICRMHQSQLHPPEEAETYKEMFKQRIKTGGGPNFDAEVINKDGVRIPVHIISSVIEIDGKKVMQGVFRDVSQLKKAEAEKKEAETLALIDPHTQLYNYRYFQRRLRTEFEVAKRHLTPLSLMFIDIDYFKSINDTYGHEFGDEVLREFAVLLERSCREIDIVTRFGGEEFIVILPDTDFKGTLSFAQRIQGAINKHKFGQYKVKLKISVGVGSYPEDGMKTKDGLLTCAENAVRLAKEKGGNAIYNCRDIRKKKLEASIIEAVSKRRVKAISKKFIGLSKRSNQNIVEAVYALAHTVGAKDAYTEAHSEDMVFFATEIGKKLSLSEEELEDLKHGAMLHDIGKIGISDNILLKKGKLTKKEFEAVKKHPQIGADIIRPVHFLKNVVPMILHHHERFDGYGYGSKLRGEEIPLGARIIGLVDAYQALTSNRPYRKAYSKKEAQKIIKEESGRHFDPKIVKVFLEFLAKKRKER